MAVSVRTAIDEFLAEKRIVFAGVSRDPKHFSHVLLSEFQSRGYEIIPVNPLATEIAGLRCYAHIADIPLPVKAALVLTSGDATDQVVRDAVAAGITHVWLYRAVGSGAVTPSAIAYCESRNIALVPGECPMMFLHDAAWYHRFHGLVRRISGSYPKTATSGAAR